MCPNLTSDDQEINVMETNLRDVIKCAEIMIDVVLKEYHIFQFTTYSAIIFAVLEVLMWQIIHF